LVASPAGHQRFVGREKIHSCAILALWAGEELFGILFVNYRNPKSFAPELRTRMQALASTAANVIRTARFYAWMTARDKQLKALEQVDRAIVDSFQGPGVNDFLNVILRESAHFSQATSGAIFRPTAENDENKLTAAACYTARETNTETGLHCRFGEGAAGRCAVSRKPEPVLRRDESEAGWISEESKSCIAIPIIASHENSELIGVLLLESDRYEAFAQEDQIVFQNLARQAVIGVHSIERYLQLKKEQNLAVAISTIATRIQRVEYSLDLVIYQILTAITADEGVGFSRAMVFLCEENCAALRGFSAKGEISCEDAHGTWEAAVRESSIEKALDDAIEYYRAVERGAKISALLAAIRGQVIPLQMGGAIARCAALNSNTYIPVRGDQADPFRAWISQTTGEDFEGISFVCVPLLIREKTIGVLVVDDRFKLIEKNEIPCTKIVRLTAYAELAAMSIESAQLMEKTQTQTYEDMAHQLKKPLARAKDHCAALTRNMGSKNRGTDDTLLKMKAMVGRALNVSMNLKLYADLARERPLSPKLTILDPYSLVQLIQNSVDDLRASTDPDLELIFQPLENNEFHELSNLMVMADMDLLREALENLLDNAVKYSFRGSTIVIRARSTYGPEGFKLIVGNTGKHIEADEVELIKRRGYRGPHSAEVTSEGSGIGLWVVNGIMAAHGGLLLPEPTTANHYTQIGLWFPTVSEGGRPS
jgi:signal transduction histidine kinase/GAF domain-containing protein